MRRVTAAPWVRTLRRIGWAYVAYHLLVAVLLVASALRDLDQGDWRRVDVQLETAFVGLLYPALIPALVVCGGPHDRCTTALGHAGQIAAFVGSAACYLAGWWVLVSEGARRVRRLNGGPRAPA